MAGEKRRADRYRVKLRVRVRVRGRTYLGWVTDVSKGGMRVSTDEAADIVVGDEVEVESPELGLMAGKARWRAPSKFGLMFEVCSNTAAKYEILKKRFAYTFAH